MDLEAQVYEDQKARRNLAAAGRRLPPTGPGLGSNGPTCGECGRGFDLSDSTDSAEWYFGHDCEEI